MSDDKLKAVETADYLLKQIAGPPRIGLLTGTGLGDCAAFLHPAAVFDYGDLPHFSRSTVQSHKGQLLFGDVAGRSVMAMLGRFHLYEGYSAKQVAFPIRVMQELGVRTLIISNASGGLNPAFTPGDIMIIRDHLNLTGENPLVGPNEESWGIRFPDMGAAYDPDLAGLAAKIADAAEISRQTGVYAGLKGPSLETPAEVRYLKSIGADAVGFSTIQETLAAVHAGMRVVGLSTITNVHNPDDPAPATLEEILEVAADATPRLATLVRSLMEAVRVD
jgi:purine-nucleoside phosphorylase